MNRNNDGATDFNLDAPPPLPPPFDPSDTNTNASPVYQDIADIPAHQMVNKDKEINKAHQENEYVHEVTTEQTRESRVLKNAEVYKITLCLYDLAWFQLDHVTRL